MKAVKAVAVKGLLGVLAACVLAACAQVLPPARESSVLTPQSFGSSGYDRATALTTHSAGVYVVGYTKGLLAGANLGDNDAFVRKYGSGGGISWQKQFGTHAADVAWGVAGDSGGSAYVVGSTSGALVASQGGSDAFIRKYGSSGSVLWTRQFGTANGDAARLARMDGSSNLIVAGTNGSSGPVLPSSDVFLRKYKADGSLIWEKKFSIGVIDSVAGLARDSDNNLYIAGTSRNSLLSPSKRTPYLRKYSPSGTFLWQKTTTFSGDQGVGGVAADGSGNAYLLGTFTYSSLPSLKQNVFVQTFTSSGTAIDSGTLITNQDDYATDLRVSGSNVYVAGYTYGALGGPQKGAGDAFVSKLKLNLDEIWTHQFGSPQNDVAYAVTFKSADEIFVAGSTAGAIVGVNHGSHDAFIRRVDGAGGSVWTDQ